MTSRTRGRVPDFFIVGQAKCATSTLHDLLSQHPGIHAPVKEPTYFAHDLRWRHEPRHLRYTRPTNFDEYVALFAGAGDGQLIGEASTQYLFSHDAADAIADARPDAKIIAIFREPASFLRSLHRELVKQGIESEHDFATALRLEDDRRSGRCVPTESYLPQLLLYREHVRYADQLARFSRRFPSEQMLVLLYEDVIADVVSAAQDIVRFLGLEDEMAVAAVHRNKGALLKSRRMQRLMHELTVGDSAAVRIVRAGARVVPRRLRKAVTATAYERFVFGDSGPEPEVLMQSLRSDLAPEIECLARALGSDRVRTLWSRKAGDV